MASLFDHRDRPHWSYSSLSPEDCARQGADLAAAYLKQLDPPGARHRDTHGTPMSDNVLTHGQPVLTGSTSIGDGRWGSDRSVWMMIVRLICGRSILSEASLKH